MLKALPLTSQVAAQWGDSMRGLRYQRARNALLELEKLGEVRLAYILRISRMHLPYVSPSAPRARAARRGAVIPYPDPTPTPTPSQMRHTKNWRPQLLLFCKAGYDGMVTTTVTPTVTPTPTLTRTLTPTSTLPLTGYDGMVRQIHGRYTGDRGRYTGDTEEIYRLRRHGAPARATH